MLHADAMLQKSDNMGRGYSTGQKMEKKEDDKAAEPQIEGRNMGTVDNPTAEKRHTQLKQKNLS